MKNIINKIRLGLIKKILKPKDGYIYVGLCNNEDIGFYYDKKIGKYVLGMRCGNFYYKYPTISGWVAYRSRYLGKERENEIEKIPFQDWIYGILDTIYEDYKHRR